MSEEKKEEKPVEETKPTEAPKTEVTKEPEVKQNEQKGAWEKKTEEKSEDHKSIKKQVDEAKKEGMSGWQITLIIALVIFLSAGAILLMNEDLRNEVIDFFKMRFKKNE